MRRAAKVDGNSAEIISAFRKLGCSVLPLHTVGSGCPDICVGKNFKNVLVEIKDGSKTKSARELTKDEQKFHEEWRGLVIVVQDLGGVLDLVRALEKGAV